LRSRLFASLPREILRQAGQALEEPGLIMMAEPEGNELDVR
jgi:hypothetical protein